MTMLPHAIVNDEGFSVALQASGNTASEQTRRIIDMNGSHRAKTLDMKGMGTQSQINNTALLSLIAGGGRALIFSATASASNDSSPEQQNIADMQADTNRLDLQLLNTFGADILDVKDMALAISEAMTNGLTTENPEIAKTLSDAIAQLADIKTLSEILKDAPDNVAAKERLEAMLEDMAETIEALAQIMPLHSTALALQLSRGVASVISPVNDLIDADTLSKLEAQNTHLETRQETIAQLTAATATIREILDTADLREMLSDAEIEALQAELEALEAAQAELESLESSDQITAAFEAADIAVQDHKAALNTLIQNAQANASPSLLVLTPSLLQTIEAKAAAVTQPKTTISTASIERTSPIQKFEARAISIANSVAKNAPADIAKPLAAAIVSLPVRQIQPASPAATAINQTLAQTIQQTAQQENLPPKLQTQIQEFLQSLPFITPLLTPAAIPAPTGSNPAVIIPVNDNTVTEQPTAKPEAAPESDTPPDTEPDSDEPESNQPATPDEKPENKPPSECPGGGPCQCPPTEPFNDVSKPPPPITPEEIAELKRQDQELETYIENTDTEPTEAEQAELDALITDTAQDPEQQPQPFQLPDPDKPTEQFIHVCKPGCDHSGSHGHEGGQSKGQRVTFEGDLRKVREDKAFFNNLPR